ncbi:MAG: amino acid adenylation domain-containing protein [Lysobacteraceae bacterium]
MTTHPTSNENKHGSVTNTRSGGADGDRTDATVHGLFRECAERHPDRVALSWPEGQMDYEELDRRSDALALRLRELGAAADRPIALCLPRSPQAVVAALAILKAGGAYLPLDPEYPAARLRHIVEDAAATILVTDAAHAGVLTGIAAQTLTLDVIGMDEHQQPVCDALDARLQDTAPAANLAYVMYTSGSTGMPKGVQIEHRSILRLVVDVDYVRLDEETCFLHAAPLGFDASTLELWGPLLNGGRCAILTAPVPDARALAEAIDGMGVTTAWLTAALFNAVIDESPQSLRGLRQLFTGGEALSPSHVRRALQALPDISLHNGYGPTECTTFATTYAIPRDLAEDATSIPIGRPIAHTHVHVLDAQQQPVAAGDTGELYIGGRGVARGYLGRPDLDAERFLADPFDAGERLYRTGDLVRWRDAGADAVLEFVGRVDDQLKIRGFRIEPGEIESVLSRVPGVRACAVVAKPGSGGGKRLIAYVVADVWDIAQARAALVRELPDYMVPSAFLRLPVLPITANGKLDRAALPVPSRERPELQHPYRAPRSERERAICAAFADVLELDHVGMQDAFFELGGDSLSALRVLLTLRTRGIGDLRPAQLFEAPTPAGVARLLDGDASALTMPSSAAKTPSADAPIAIVGMAGRFPGAEDIEAFWRNLCAGQESIRVFAPDELDPSIPRALIDDPAYVRARGVIDGVDRFDAAFFGIAPLEAQLMDPQHRHFLETAWHALEHAGYVPERVPGRVGVFGGMYNASYFLHHVQSRPDLVARLGEMQTMLANEKDYLTSRVAYKLGLDGPAVSVHTACSTSLVATIMAMESLRNGDCDLALAGGVAITCPPNSGYLYQEGAMASRDGHTRSFDADAAGTVFSDGVAILALRRLSDALVDGDTVYAVLLGGAINNDGADRASFTAPNPAGQATVIAMAHDSAGIDARSISYVEAHGTATPIGDPIEVAGLTRAFRRHTEDRGFCGIGSLKSNVGHLVTAAGAAGLIKTALALHREMLPPTIGYARPNPQIDFDASPFVPQAALQAWPRGAQPRRAGVSAFGFGGTNAHVVLQEAPLANASVPSLRPQQLLTLSARTPEALTALSQRMATYLDDACLDDADAAAMLSFADIAHTARIGRRAFAYRRSVVAADRAEAARLLAATSAAGAMATTDAPEVAFLCPGQGAQYPAMGHGLYAAEPVFRDAYDACCAVLASQMQIGANTANDVCELFFSDAPDVLVATHLTQPAVFALEYALARLWMSWGVEPGALIGHSVGEFVCATLAGVMSLADALALVALRGRLMQLQPAGSMLSVRLSADAMSHYLDDTVELAAENSPALCVVAGPTPDIARLEARLAADGVAAKRLMTSHAFHSAMMQPVVAPMLAQLQTMTLHAPRIPIVSTVTGDWLSDADARDPQYWAEHLRRPVRFAPAASRLLEDPNRLLIEVGPRGTLATLAKQCAPKGRATQVAIASLGDSDALETSLLAQALGQAWTLGVAPDWKAYVAHESRRRVPLPGYPFARDRHWVDAVVKVATVADVLPNAPLTAEPASTIVQAVVTNDIADASDTLPRLVALIEDVSGFEIGTSETDTPWLELGLDSLALTQLALQLQRAFQVKVTFRQIMEQYGTAAQLATHLDASRAPAGSTAPSTASTAVQVAAQPTGGDDSSEGPMSYDVKKAFGAIARIHTRADAMTPRQRTRLDALIARYVTRTGKSKAYTTQHRQRMADPRVVNGFRPLTKELTYQLVIERSRNSRMWDLDGNEYVDVLNGFGMNLFGWQPDFLRDTLHERIDLGYEIGPQHVLAGETAELFADLTGSDRVAFCNTGSEAVMGTMRIARTVTGRSTIAIFTGAYHGIFDEVIVRGTKKLRSVPAAPGIMPSTAQNVLVLDYGTEESLQILRERAHELAAILVEPVQSRRPDFQPVEFLRELRTLTEDSGSLLIFDEVVTGFRAHPRGVQGLFDIQADLAAYGKVVGGGFSIGVIAGKRAYMDALDGGHWDYGDDSVPTVGVTYFAGTFVRHPLALAAAKATLKHLQDAGPELQLRLTARTANMVERVNAAMEELGAPFKLVTFASWWRNVFTEDLPYGDLIYVMLRDRGIHILDNFPCFLTTSHTDEDIDLIVAAYRDAAAEMIASEFFPVRRREQALAEDGTRVVPTTEPQREIWLADQLGTEASLAYNESVSLHLRGALDVERLRAAVQALPQRHDALRATFSDDGLWLKIPAQAAVFEIALRDVSASQNPQAELAAICERHVSEPFDLGAGPLLRAEIVRLAPEHHVLVLTGHHIVLDGWSFWVLVKDLAAQYRPDALQAAAPSFADYAVEQSASDADPADELAWWIALFADGGPVLDLPCDRPRPSIRTQRAGREDHVLPADLLADVRQLGARRGASLFATLLAGFSALLHRLTGQDDVVIGVPAAGQSASGQEGLVGHCVHMLPLRIQPHGELPFERLIDQSRGMLLDAYDHQRITFGRLLRALPIPRERSRLPLMSVIFNIDQALTGEHDAMPGLQLDLDSNARRFETFELFVNAVDLGAAGMRLECQYNADLFDAQTVARWLSGFEILLRAAVADVGSTLDALSVLTPEDRQSINAWNATEADYPRETRIEALILDQALRTPDAIAVTAGSKHLTYAQLADRSAAIAIALQTAGVRRGDRVGLLLERDLELLPALLGVLRAGACYVPLDPALPEERLGFMIEDAQLRILLGDTASMARFDSVLASTVHLHLHRIPDRGDTALRDVSADAEDDAYIIYTSGSTGRPKGVRVRHRNVANLLASMRRTPGMQAQDVVLAVTTLAFDIAVCELILPLSVGATVVLADRRDAADADRLRALLETHRVNIMQATPATWRLLLESGWRGHPGLKALSGGEPLAADLAAALLPCVAELWNVYGPTETTVWSSHHRVVDANAPIPIGVPLANTRLLVLDAHRQPVPVGVVGELYIGGDGVACGYLNRPELTAERFVPDADGQPLYRTGDLARWRRDGVVECLGRTDFQVKLRGYRIELGEIEQVLLSHPDIAQAVVVTHEPRPGDLRLIAYVVAQPESAFDGSRASEDGLRAHAAKLLPEYMLPQRCIALPALPLTVSGKIDRKALPAPTDASPSIDSGEPEDFPDARQAQVAQQYRDALALSKIGPHDDFFALGGHSLLAAQLAAKLGRELDRHVPMRVVFDHPTVAGLAAWLAAQEATMLPTVVALAHGERAPLSLMQQRIWYLEQLHPGRTVYNVPSAHRLRGALDRDALSRAFAGMVRRQAALRTTIGMHEGEPFQQLHETVDTTLRFEDLTDFAADACEAELALRMEDGIALPFDLAHGPLFRACVYKLGDDEHVMFFMAHHAIWDGWSFDLFYTEMAALYDAYRHGREPSLALPPVSYADFSAWHREWMDGPELTRQLDHWRSKLQGMPEALALPTDKPRPATQSGDGDTAWLRVPDDTADALRALAQREGSTLFTVLLSAWTLLLHQLSGQRDLVIGTPVRGRNLPELESVMGFFVNALPLRLQVDPAQGFRSLLQTARVEMIDALGCQDVPFEHLVRVLGTHRDTSRFPIYQAFFSYQDARQRPCRWSDLAHANVPVFQPAAAQDVALWFLDGADGLVGGLNYNTDILIADTATLLVERYLALLDGLVGALATSSDDVPLRALLTMTPAESARIAAWNDTAAPMPDDRDLSHYLDDAIARHGDRAQVLSTEGAISHAALSAQADRIATALRARGIGGRDVGSGAVVGLHLQRSPSMLAAMLGVLRAGAAYLPLDPGFPAERLKFMVADADAALVIDDSDNDLGLDATHRLTLDDALATEAMSGLRFDHHDSDALAYLIYTSGSTGKPKGVRVPQRAVINFLESMRVAPGLDASSRLAAVTTLSFDIAVLELLLPLAVGADLVLVARDEASDGVALRALLEHHRVDTLQATPSTWRLLLESGWRGGPQWKALCGGEALPADLAEALLPRVGALWNMYGPTETTVWSTCAQVRPGQGEIVVGRPIANTQVHVLDDNGMPVPVGVTGELVIAGAGVTLGYHKRDELTAEKFIADRFADAATPGARMYRTGDLGRWRSDGQLQHLGRLDQQIKLRGYRIETGEIESILARHPDVAQVVVVAAARSSEDAILAAYIVPRAGAGVDGNTLRAHLRGELPDYMLPTAWIEIAQVPTTPNGKVDRNALPPIASTASAAKPRLSQAPSTQSERWLADVWRELLGIDAIGVQDNFLDLGGHSLLIMRAVAMLHTRHGVSLSPRAFVFQTLAQIAAECDAQLGTGTGAVGDAAREPANEETLSSGFFGRLLSRFGKRRA